MSHCRTLLPLPGLAIQMPIIFQIKELKTFILSLGMKRPFSPVEDGSNRLTEQTGHEGVSSDGVEFTRQDAPSINPRPKRERKHRSYTLCEVCNIQLNSAAQAQIHYNGKTHQKRLKHINNSNTGMICVSFSGVPVIIGAQRLELLALHYPPK